MTIPSRSSRRICQGYASALATMLFFALLRLEAGESPYPIAPAAQPLLIARTADANKPADLFSAAPIQALGLGGSDYRGSIPALGGKIESLRSLLGNLAEGGATNLWYCLMQSGSSLAAGMGWRWQEGFSEGRALEWMRGNSFNPETLTIRLQPREGYGLAASMAKKAETLNAITGNGNAKSDARSWNRSLNEFLTKPTDAFGIWGNPRPALGLAALASEVDFRGTLARLNLSIPYAAWLEANTGGNQLDVEFGVDGLFLQPPEAHADFSLDLDFPPPPTDGPFVRLTLASPYSLLKAMRLDTLPLYLANLNFKSLVPRLACLDIWIDAEGATRWALVCLMREKSTVQKHFRRLIAWCDLLSGLSESFDGVSPLSSPAGSDLYSVDFRDFSILTGLVTVGGGERDIVFLFAAERLADYPIAENIAVKSVQRKRVFSWQVRLDDETRRLAARRFVFWAARNGLPQVKSDAFANALPTEECGRVAVAGDGLVVASPQGMALWLTPTLSDLARTARNELRFFMTGE